MKSLFFLILIIIGQYPSLASEIKLKYGPAGNPRATPLSQSNEYFRSPKNRAPDYWALAGFYVPQINGAACSAASVTMVLNAARAGLSKTSEDKVITQKDLLDKVTVEQWKQRLGEGGMNGEYGIAPIERLGKITEAAFKSYGFSNASVKVVHVENTSAQTKKELIAVLRENEKSAKDFVIANFNQKFFTDDAEAGHIAPIAAYDAEKERVLIFDPDRDYFEPYWISMDTFLAGMATLDKGAKAYRGYVVIRLGNE